MKSLRNVRSRLPTGLTINRARNDACRQDFVSFIEGHLIYSSRQTIVHELAYSGNGISSRIGTTWPDKTADHQSPAALSKVAHLVCGVSRLFARSRPDETLARSLIWL